MEHMSDPKKEEARRSASRTHRDRRQTAARVSACLRGLVFAGVSYLLGTCPLPFGALPLGISILCASSSSTLYIWGGLCLSALHPAFPLPFWAGWLIYTCTLLLRLIFGYLSERSDKDEPLKRSPSALSWFTQLLERWQYTESEEDTTTDYYCGRRNTPARQAEEPSDEPPAERSERGIFREPMVQRMLTAALGGFALGLCGMFSGGFAVYDLLAFLLMLLAAPLFTYLLSPCFSASGQALLFSSEVPDALPRQGHRELLKRHSLLTLISVLSLLFLCTLGSRQHVLTLYSPYLTLRLSPILAMLLTMESTAAKGLIPGLVVALLCGLAADPILAPALILAVLIYSLLRFLSHRAAMACGSVAALLWVLFGGGISTMVTYLPSLLLSVPLCLALQKISAKLPHPEEKHDTREAANDFTFAMEQKTRTEAHRARLKALSEAFTSLSHMFYELSGKLRRPRLPELRRMCDEVIDRHCARCRYRERCDKAVCHPADLISARVSARLYHEGRADVACIPPETAQQCLHLNSILEDINTRYAKLSEQLLKSEKTEVFATDYESVADMIRDTLEDDEEEYRCNREAADRIFEWLTAHGVVVLGVMVCGTRSCRVIVRGSHFDRSESALRDLRTEFEAICATRLTLPAFEAEGEHSNTSVMRLSSEEVYDTVYAAGTVPAGGHESDVLTRSLTNEYPSEPYTPPAICGDHIALFKSDNACFYALISDGMGSGEEASLTSDICALFLERMLSAGNRVELSVRMLNSLIRQKNNGAGEECSATVDLMELDLMSGQAIFAKNGAAPTYVVRGGKVYKLRSRTLPIGILKDSDPQLLRFRMHPGDVVVMVSDGVTGGNDECPWLIDLLSDPLPESMDSLRLKILRHAIASGSPDDLSAIAIRVGERT